MTIANAPGNGVADDKAVYPYVPAMIEYYLGEVPILANVETYRLEDAEVCEWALDRIDELVFKPVDGSGGYGLVIGPARQRGDARRAARQGARRTRAAGSRRSRSRCRPRRRSSTAGWAPRHLDLRPFAVNDGRDVWVVPGGLTRVALPEGSLVVNSSQGGGSKDTWVLAGARPPTRGRRPTRRCTARRDRARRRRPPPGPLPAQDAQQQQQQQQRVTPC